MSADQTPSLLTDADQSLIKTLVDSKLKGFANARLSKLKPAVLDELVRVYSGPADPPLGAEIDLKVKRILASKKELLVAAKRGTALAAPAAAPAAAPIEPPARRQVFREGHGISIVAFNSLKLRLDKPDLKEEWSCAVKEFAKHDVLMLSEVRAGDKHFKPRILRLIEMLEESTEAQWAWQMSEPSNAEVHLLIVKRPIDIVKVQTLSVIEGLALDYAPLVAHIDDHRFTGELRRFCVTSVHLPPNSGSARRSQRDAQISKLLATYPVQADLRLGLPFTDMAAKETRQKHPYTAHVLAGDWNASASELRELGAEKHGFEVVFGNLSTSSGGKAYDNFLVSKETKDHLMLSTHIYDLTRFANFAKGEQGLSDHAPVVLALHEQPPRL